MKQNTVLLKLTCFTFLNKVKRKFKNIYMTHIFLLHGIALDRIEHF